MKSRKEKKNPDIVSDLNTARYERDAHLAAALPFVIISLLSAYVGSEMPEDWQAQNTFSDFFVYLFLSEQHDPHRIALPSVIVAAWLLFRAAVENNRALNLVDKLSEHGYRS